MNLRGRATTTYRSYIATSASYSRSLSITYNEYSTRSHSKLLLSYCTCFLAYLCVLFVLALLAKRRNSRFHYELFISEDLAVVLNPDIVFPVAWTLSMAAELGDLPELLDREQLVKQLLLRLALLLRDLVVGGQSVYVHSARWTGGRARPAG